MTLQIITANNLRDGDVVYLSTGGKWTGDLNNALGVDSKDALESMLATASIAEENRQVVGFYSLPVKKSDRGFTPLSMKERIRSLGPTTHPELGKQAYA